MSVWKIEVTQVSKTKNFGRPLAKRINKIWRIHFIASFLKEQLRRLNSNLNIASSLTSGSVTSVSSVWSWSVHAVTDRPEVADPRLRTILAAVFALSSG